MHNCSISSMITVELLQSCISNYIWTIGWFRQMHGELVFDIAWCCQPHRMGHGQHLNLKWISVDWWKVCWNSSLTLYFQGISVPICKYIFKCRMMIFELWLKFYPNLICLTRYYSSDKGLVPTRYCLEFAKQINKICFLISLHFLFIINILPQWDPA